MDESDFVRELFGCVVVLTVVLQCCSMTCLLLSRSLCGSSLFGGWEDVVGIDVGFVICAIGLGHVFVLEACTCASIVASTALI